MNNTQLDFIDRFGPQFWLDDRLTGAAHARMISYIRGKYIAGGGGVLRETALTLDKFRHAARGALDNADDEEIYDILCFAVQRIRNCADVLRFAEICTYPTIRIIAIYDEETPPLCRFLDGKYIRTATAVRALQYSSCNRKSAPLKRLCPQSIPTIF